MSDASQTDPTTGHGATTPTSTPDLSPPAPATTSAETGAGSPPTTAASTTPPPGGGSAGSSAGSGSGTDRAQDITERLRPLAVAAEEVAAQVVHLSARGLDRLGRFLDERRQARRAAGDDTAGGSQDGPS